RYNRGRRPAGRSHLSRLMSPSPTMPRPGHANSPARRPGYADARLRHGAEAEPGPTREYGPAPGGPGPASAPPPGVGRAESRAALGRRGLLPLLPILLLAAVSFGFGPPKLTDSDQPRMALYPKQLVELARSKPPELKGSAALVMDAATGRTVYEL